MSCCTVAVVDVTFDRAKHDGPEAAARSPKALLVLWRQNKGCCEVISEIHQLSYSRLW
jgi:hypothetical protein